MRFRSTWVILALVSVASTGGAQIRRTTGALAVEWRHQLGELADTLDRRKGLSVRIQADFPWKKYASWRVEGSYIQVKYDRFDPDGNTAITETDFEASGFLRLFLPRGTKAIPYLLGGGVGSIRGNCNLDNAFSSYETNIRCGEGEDYLFGWGVGGGVQFPAWIAGMRMFVEARVLSNVTAAGGGRLLAISFGAGQ